MTMTWYKELYTGSLASSRSGHIREKIENGEYPPGVYVVTLPSGKGRLLEIMSADQLKNRYVRSSVRMSVGLAGGKSEAEDLVAKIIKETLDAQKDMDVGRFLEERDRG